MGSADALPGTATLTWQGDLAARMVEGIRHDLLRRTDAARAARGRRSPSVSTADRTRRRARLARILGVGVDRRRRDAPLQILSPAATDGPLARAADLQVHAVRWPVLDGVDGEGLLVQPTRRPLARVVLWPDGSQTPEQLCGLQRAIDLPRAALRLARSGCAVVVPQPVDRDTALSVVTGADATDVIRATNMPHREFVYRAAYELGRHVLGYEIESLVALLDAWEGDTPIGVLGWGGGGRVALYAAALDERLVAAGVSGAFGPRESTWTEPIDRNLFDLLTEFGDAEVAALVAPRRLVVEAARVPTVDIPRPDEQVRREAAPGCLATPSRAEIADEVERAAHHVRALRGASGFLDVIQAPGRRPGSDDFLRAFVQALGSRRRLAPDGPAPRRSGRTAADITAGARARRDRVVGSLIAHTQEALTAAQHRRQQTWQEALRHLPSEPLGDSRRAEVARERATRAFVAEADRLRRRFDREFIGRLPAPRGDLRPRSRLVYDEPGFRGYEVVLDVYGRDGEEAHVFVYGILLVPKEIPAGQRRPVVVCQHGLEGRPQDVADPALDHHAYHTFACRLAERGFVVFAPQNPYIGVARYRDIQRLANPLGLSLFSVIVRQHERILEWLGGLPFVEATRIAFYGLSYGGKTAMRVPALLPGYCLSICSADYNEWIWKCVSTRHRWSYMGTAEYDMPEFDLGNSFNYAEMSWLIFPRPFMVERGHHDGVAPDEWVAYEYARTRRVYALLGHGDRTQIEFFDGPHTIHGEGTFAFLEKHLR